MKHPDEIYAEIYLERAPLKGHDVAVAEALAAVLFDLQDRREHDYQTPAFRFKKVADDWHRGGNSSAQLLREQLRHAWTDVVLSTRR